MAFVVAHDAGMSQVAQVVNVSHHVAQLCIMVHPLFLVIC